MIIVIIIIFPFALDCCLQLFPSRLRSLAPLCRPFLLLCFLRYSVTCAASSALSSARHATCEADGPRHDIAPATPVISAALVFADGALPHALPSAGRGGGDGARGPPRQPPRWRPPRQPLLPRLQRPVQPDPTAAISTLPVPTPILAVLALFFCYCSYESPSTWTCSVYGPDHARSVSLGRDASPETLLSQREPPRRHRVASRCPRCRSR
jgi:hypothetical protein